MGWNDITYSNTDPSTTNSFYYTLISDLYTEAYKLATGDYNLYRVSPDGDRQWKDYWIANNPPGLDLLDSTSDIYEDFDILLDEADDIYAQVHLSMTRYLGENHYDSTDVDDATIELMSKGRYLKFRIEFLDTTGFDFSEVQEYWDDIEEADFDQMDDDGDGLISDTDLVYFLDQPIEGERDALPSSYTPEVTLRSLWLDMIEIRNRIKTRKWKSKLQANLM